MRGGRWFSKTEVPQLVHVTQAPTPALPLISRAS